MMQVHIMIVDDDEDDLRIFKDAALDVHPAIVCTSAQDCEEGIGLLKTGLSPDFIFLDLNTPKMDGFQCLAELQKVAHWKTIPTLIYTTSSNKVDMQKAIAAGAQGFIVKPNGYGELKDIIKYALAREWETLERIAIRKTGY